MTPEQEKHLADIKEFFFYRVENKYRRGQEEHGGNLFDMSPLQLVENAIDENVDSLVYLYSVREKLING